MNKIELRTDKEYEWFLKDFYVKISSQRLKLYWGCVDADYEILESCLLVNKGDAGPRLKELMSRINGITSDGTIPKPLEFFKKGMHIFARVQRHWPESKSEVLEFEFVYPTIKPERTRRQMISDGDRKKILFRIAQSHNLTEARSRVEAYDPALVPVLEEMVRNGEVKLP